MRNGWHKLPKARIDKYDYNDMLKAYVYLMDNEMVSIRELAFMFDLKFNEARCVISDIKQDSHSGTHSSHTKPSKNAGLRGDFTQRHTESTQQEDYTALLKQEEELKKKTTMCKFAQDDFTEFWKHYPKRKAKAVAEKAFNKIAEPRPGIDVLIAAIRVQKATVDWKKDNGQFIPLPATWLNQRRWEDEIDDPDVGNDSARKIELERIESLKQTEERERRELLGISHE